jgi:PLAC (protease and lacunin) domain
MICLVSQIFNLVCVALLRVAAALEANLVGAAELPRAQLLARTDHEVENCRDLMRDCGLVLRARLCANRFYRTRCCVTCSKAAP